MPRFVLLYHDCPPNYERPSHWDFMLESGDVLRTWALAQLPDDWRVAHARTHAAFPNCPALADNTEVAAQQLSDHRRDYLEFEGELTNNRGRVIRVAQGSYEMAAESASKWQVLLSGTTIDGPLQLERNGAGEIHWTLSLTFRSPQRKQGQSA